MTTRLAGTFWVLGLCLVPVVQPVRGQETVELEKVRGYVNRLVTVEGKVAKVMEQSGDAWISLGRPYPGGPLVIIIPADQRSAFTDLNSWQGRTVRVTGRVHPSALEEPPPLTGDPNQGRRRPRKPYIVVDNPGLLIAVPPGQP